MGQFVKSFLLFLVCNLVNVKPIESKVSGSKLETIMDDAMYVKENLTERMDTLAAYLSESVNLMKSMEARFMKAYHKHLGMKNNWTDKHRNGGAVYTRWGNDTCPDEAVLIFHGFAASGHYTHTGAGTNILCTHGEPQFEKTFPSNTTLMNYLYGVEYEQIWRADLTDQDVPCVVCRSWSRTAAILVPGRHECMTGWHTEYWGFLVGPNHSDAGNGEYICLDSNPDSIEGGYQSHNGRILYNVRYECGALPCPPYKGGYYVPCAMCTS